MNLILKAAFNEKDLVRLDSLRELLEDAYSDRHVVEVVYERIIYSLSRSRSAVEAQRRLDFEIGKLEYFTYALDDAIGREEIGSVFDEINELEDIQFIEDFLHKWRDLLLWELRKEQDSNYEK